MNSLEWYQQLITPAWAPPSWLFSPVWTILYIIIGITFFHIFRLTIHKKIPKIVALPFVLNLIFNASFTPLQFGLQHNLLALIDIIFVLATLIWLMIAIYKYNKQVALANIPYLLWVSFATVLQGTITYLNW